MLSVFETFMNFRDPPQAGSAFFVTVHSLVARRRCHPVAFQEFRIWAFVQIIGASGVDAVMSGVDRAGVIKECAAGAMTGRAGRKKELGRCSARKKSLRILHFQIYSVHLHHQNGLCRDGTGESVAQQVEHNTFNVGVLGSSPSGFTKWSGSRTTAGFFVCGSLHERPVYRTKVQYTGLSLIIQTALLFTNLLQMYCILFHCLNHDKFQEYES